MDCNCPAPTALTPITTENCGVNLKQIQRLAFQRVGTGFAVIADTTDIRLKADWDLFIAAADDTKIVITPLIGGDPIIEPGDPITTGGGDNSTLNGVEEVEGANPSEFSCIFKELSAKVEKEMKALNCEKNLVVFLFLQGGRIAAVEITVNDEWDGFFCTSVFTADRGNQGFGTKDQVSFGFNLTEGWSDDLVILTSADLDFNPLTDL